MRNILFAFIFITFYSGSIVSTLVEEVTIIDSRHYSTVFAEMRNYRIFLPPGYHGDSEKRYPVIYFLHGWSQRYFGSGGDAYSEYDRGKENNGDNIAKFVSQHEVIVVKSDGYNRSKNEPYYVRPYNIGPVENYRQFPIYYPELIQHIDRTYSTQADRNHRAISGLSMGGFMSFFIGGKYPHLFSAVGSFCGSPEFVIGPKDMPVEYRHLDMYQNYQGMNVRLHYGDQDFIRGYHEDLNRIWTAAMDHYSFKVFPGDEHTTSGLGEMFDFLYRTFENPPEIPEQWDHIDVYPTFSVWDYHISSDRCIPGFTILENVDKRGFTSSIKSFLPDGSTLPHVQISILTPPVYEPNQNYYISDYNTHENSTTQYPIKSDQQGEIQINLDGAEHHISINKEADGPNISLLSYSIENMDVAEADKDVHLRLELLNKGMTSSGALAINLSSSDPAVTLKNSASSCDDIAVSVSETSKTAFIFNITEGDAEFVKFDMEISNGAMIWRDEIYIPIRHHLHWIDQFVIADGEVFTVAKSGNDLETVVVGKGNGDGIANPGEFIEILIPDNQKLWRTKVSSTHPLVNPFGIHLRRSDNWGSYDHVGGSAKHSITVIASDCSPGQEIDFALEYWLPDYPLHTIKKGNIRLKVEGLDQTAPQIGWSQVQGDNILEVKLYDGSAILSATATFLDKNKKTFPIELNDRGIQGDRSANDQVFSATVPPQKFGFYRVIIEALDSHNNSMREEISESFLLH